jgi:hypothetical protein
MAATIIKDTKNVEIHQFRWKQGTYIEKHHAKVSSRKTIHASQGF